MTPVISNMSNTTTVGLEFVCLCFASCIWHLDACKILISLHAYYCFIFQKSYLTQVLKESNALQMLMAQGQQMPSSSKSDSIHCFYTVRFSFLVPLLISCKCHFLFQIKCQITYFTVNQDLLNCLLLLTCLLYLVFIAITF